MGTVSDFNAFRQRKADHGCGVIRTSAFGFSIDECFLPWQAIASIQLHCASARDIDTPLHFTGGGRCVVVAMDQPGFPALERAMITIFPATADWRERRDLARCGEPVMLHQAYAPGQ